MKQPCASASGLETGADLDLPDAPDFVSQLPRLSWDAMFRLNEQSLAWHTRRPDFEQRRLETKSPQEFVL